MKAKSVEEVLNYINENPVKIAIESRHLPGGAEHNLICWICNKNHAVYDMHPNWCFRPCWSCQKPMYNKKNWYQFWK